MTYGVQWNHLKGELDNMLDETEARRRHESGLLYTAVIDRPGSTVLVEVRLEAGYIGVWFLDELGRRILWYAFKKMDDGRLFMTQTKLLNYEDPTLTETYFFKPDGTVMRDRNASPGMETMERKLSVAELEAMYEPVPSFGQYHSITRRERDRPASD